MNEEQNNAQAEVRFTNGFNDGYLLARFEPDLMKKISAGCNVADSPYFDGMRSGQQAYAREKVRQEMKQQAQKTHTQRPKPR